MASALFVEELHRPSRCSRMCDHSPCRPIDLPQISQGCLPQQLFVGDFFRRSSTARTQRSFPQSHTHKHMRPQTFPDFSEVTVRRPNR
jgi:hypothetical protein